MNINDAFPSNWIRAADLKGQTHALAIERWALEDMGNDGKNMKPVIYFQGRNKGLVLNKTNALTIGLVHGQELDGWIGKTIELFPAVVLFQGQNVPCIRVRPVAASYAQAFAEQPGAQPAPGPAQPGNSQPMGPGEHAAAEAQRVPDPPIPTDLDDDIPF